MAQNRMGEFSDEILMAYADGMLDEQQAMQVRQAAATDAEIGRRVDIFRQSAVLLQGVYDGPLAEPVPRRLLDTVRQFKADPAEPGMMARWVAYLRTVLVGWRAPVPAYAMAAVVVLVIGVGVGYLIPRHDMLAMVSRSDHPMGFSGGAFDRGLDAVSSGQWFTLEQAGVQIRPVTTFQDKSDAFCRRYDVAPAGEDGGATGQGIACRNLSGEWHTRVYIATGPAASGPETSKPGFVPAGADDHDLMLTIADLMMATPPLTPVEESALMDQGWNVTVAPQ